MSELAVLTHDDLTETQKKAYDLIQNGKNLFIQGCAGTGKSTFVKYLQDTLSKNIMLCSPTGVAALNIGGSTLHSMFLLPVSDVIIDDNLFKRNRSKQNRIISATDILIIDEVSMVRPDMLDAVDKICRRAKKKKKIPFGGIQVILIGDVYQLPPVITKAAEDIFETLYGTKDVYFFDSESYINGNFIKVEFDRVYRQEEDDLLKNLNNIKNKEDVYNTIRYFNSCKFSDESYKNEAVTLTPYRDTAERINNYKLDCLTSELKIYRGESTGSFVEMKTNNFPAPETLRLKVGALVMFNKNNYPSWVNGSTGIIQKLGNSHIIVKLISSGEEVLVTREEWKDTGYELKTEFVKDEETNEIVPVDKLIETTKGTFEQFPLQLGYAITIHKAQGKTLDKVIIDLNRGAFAHGQLYVSLSRTRHKEDMHISTPIKTSDVIISDRVIDFMSTL